MIMITQFIKGGTLMVKRAAIFLVVVMVVFFQAVNVVYGFSDEDLRKAKKTGECPNCDLAGAYLAGSNLHEANLSCADLSNASVSRADLTNTNLSKANSYVPGMDSDSSLPPVRYDNVL
jgi:hypothetical protein